MNSPLQLLPNTYRAFFSSFSALTAAQTQLIRPILNGEDVVLQAGTGSGKTEAVLAPATEKLIKHRGHFTIIYIVPTRALALDINRRIKPIYKKLGLKSGIRTGDGKHLLDAKPHLLIMTPESLDVLLGSSNSDNTHFLKHVQVLIIDEVHVFLHDARGIQLAYLHGRLAMQACAPLQTIALSATIDHAEDVIDFFNLNKNAFCFKQHVVRRLKPSWVHIEDEEQELVLFFEDLHLRWGCQKLLVFANSRKKCEQLFDLLSIEGIFSDKIFLHYSNLSTQERKFIETSFREKRMGVCIATSTLELGIDIGDVDGVVLIGPPPSTMAFLQRIGRGNRREQHTNFWGVCYGDKAGKQLVHFLALFALAKENQIEKSFSKENYSVLFQQILSCLYAKKYISIDFLSFLFKEKSENLPLIFNYMIENHWLKSSKQPGLYSGGWRYFMSLTKRQIWSNFPPSDEEYDVILEQEKIAVLPLSTVKQLEIGDIFQLTGRVLKFLQVEEKKAACEVWVEESNELPTKELLWIGFGSPTSFEVAQKMGEILINKSIPEGLLNRTKHLLEVEREHINRSIEQPNGIRVYRLGNGTFRYDTFLGSVGNYVLYRIIEMQLSSKIDGLSLNFDERGIESNEWISFNHLKIPHTLQQFREWISAHFSLLKAGFSWNSWLHWLPEDLKMKEVSTLFLDLRVLKHFQRYHSESVWLPLPSYIDNDLKKAINQIPLKGNPWSLENERNTWGVLSFPSLPLHESEPPFSLSAIQVQGYVAQKLCPRWARFQQIGYQITPHARFQGVELDIQLRLQQKEKFKKQVLEELQNTKRVYFETVEKMLSQAIKTAILDKKSLFMPQAKLKFDGAFGSPDLIYIHYLESHICLEVWEINFSQSVRYAQKWKIAYYAYLLELFLESEKFLLPVIVSQAGGHIYPSKNQEKLFERAHFDLAPYSAWMPRLIQKWKRNSEHSSSIENYSMEISCTSCRYFSYCYQETLLRDMPLKEPVIVTKSHESNDFPKNCKHWYFIHLDEECIRWQIWENETSINEVYICKKNFLNDAEFKNAVANQLQGEWLQSINQKKYPHFLVYEALDWEYFQNTFQSTILKSLWAYHVCWTSVQNVLQTNFLWPIEGRITAHQIATCLGIEHNHFPPLSLFHKEPFLDSSFDLYKQIWTWILANVKSRRVVSFEDRKDHPLLLIQSYLSVQHREAECRKFDIFEIQKNDLEERVKLFRAIGPMRLLNHAFEKKCFQFAIDAKAPISKFRVGDFLKLAPVGSDRIQDGFSVVLETYFPEKGILSARPLSKKGCLSKNHLYALDEDATDRNTAKIVRVLNLMQDQDFKPEVISMLLGHVKNRSTNAINWIESWYKPKALIAGLNQRQKKALILPFQEKIGLIEGPPGTGKTHLLVWTLIALVAHAKHLKQSIKILVTAQTHHAIDQILQKIAKTLPQAEVSSVSLKKYGRFDEKQLSNLGISRIQNFEALNNDSCFILGATGYGVYQLLEDKKFPEIFDWIVFDESSQILTPYALLSLVFGKGQALFYGDTQQLSPVLKGNYENASFVPCSILQELNSRYGIKNRVRLNETFRMNSEICHFASTLWYDGELQSVVNDKDQRLKLSNYPLFGDQLDDYLDPTKSMVVVQLEHLGSLQSSQVEADWIANTVKRLMNDYFISAQQIGIISPHRLQNNMIVAALKDSLPYSLKFPRVDTVERMQGSEFDIVIFSSTASDEDSIHSPFLKNYRRFNVALTRAKKKFIFVASPLFFQSFPITEKALVAQMPFEKLFSCIKKF